MRRSWKTPSGARGLAGGVDIYIAMALALAPSQGEALAKLATGPMPSELGKAEFKEKLLFGWRK